MPCSSTSNLGLITKNNKYFKNVLTQINAQNKAEKKQCICDCSILIDQNQKPYIFPSFGGYSQPFIVGDEVYSTLASSCASGGGSFQLTPVDPQKMMDLMYGLKSINVSWQDRTDGGQCDDSTTPAGRKEQKAVSGTIDVPNSTEIIDRLCNVPSLAQTLPNQFWGECDSSNPMRFNGYMALGFYTGGTSGPYFFLQEQYQEPECGQPGPILYIASCANQSSSSSGTPNYSINLYSDRTSINNKAVNKLLRINSVELDAV